MGAYYVQTQPSYPTILHSDILIWLIYTKCQRQNKARQNKALPRMQLLAKIRLGDKNIIFGGLEDVGKELVLGSYEV